MKLLRPISICLIALALSGGTAPAAGAKAIDLRELRETKLVGTPETRGMSRVAPAGDVNGDDEPDLLVAGSDRARRGIVRVFFGPLPRENTTLGKTPEHGFSIYLADEDDQASSAAAAGDVNGDGLGDVVVGSLGANEDSGRAYVVFGTREPDDVYLATFDAGTHGSDGFRVDGGGLGSAVGGVGDTDGDGLADFFVATPFRHLYLVRGKTDPFPVDLTTFDYGIQGDAGYRIHQQMPRTGLYNAASAGDVNGDGLGDVVIATERRNFDYDVWVVFGKPGNADVQLEDLGEGGFFIEGSIGDAGSGLSAAGDVNGDDKDDLVVGAGSANMAYVVFGRAETSSISLFELGRRGYRIFGEPRAPGTYLGRTGGVVTGGTDVNGDGLSDFVVADYEAGHRDRKESGSVYLLFGKGSSKPIRLRRLGSRGIRLDGEVAGDRLGITPALPGDVTDDGRPDLVIGAAAPLQRYAGKVHVISHRALFRTPR